ncbi:rodlin [Streptomyces sp. Je 1-4]|uniref:rodlin n=1 Tax=Streptomyces TaxID=1883 RepID=UPI00140F08D6|nr:MULTISPECIES: rodlin [unclassified Streptomyces]QIK07337.1 RdlA protein [Streptomyces sp. ID38640]UYB40798.1 rodlin [Streptomyces sp. Je 1-4]UZQ36951.1 rodlin [Streptomyces sp. Je 1-4] [Streptomyces sp. Je 1-4 4N24]UZQ44368.1 rodlin [Streptomyces sp. Je 1-4] [Streptomyces sp. Je 1-4 4N24_ara]
MIKKVLATTAVAASVVGISAAAAPQAMATGNDKGTSTVNGNGATSAFGNSTTRGSMSPQLELIQGSLNKLCLALPKVNLAAVAQDINVLSSPQNQQCVENSSQAKGDEPLSHILDDIAVLAANGVGNR